MPGCPLGPYQERVHNMSYGVNFSAISVENRGILKVIG